MSRVNPGDELSASKWNRMADAAERFYRDSDRGRSNGSQAAWSDACIVKVRNDSGDDRRIGEILEFNDFALANPALPSDNKVWMVGGAVAMANGFGVLREPLAEEGEGDTNIGSCQVFGACIALVNLISASHQYASPKKDSYVLQSAPAGPVRILFKPTGTGEKTCAVFVTLDSTATVKPVDNIDKGNSGDCKVWLNGADTGATVNLLALGADVAGGNYATQWCGFVLPWECG